MMRYI